MEKSTEAIKKYLDDRLWNNLAPANMAKSISIEAAELLEIFQWKNYTVEQIKENKELEEKVKKELGDIMIYCIEMAIHLNLDIEKVILEKLSHNEKKYPAEEIMKHKGEDYKNSFYIKRKMEYRDHSIEK